MTRLHAMLAATLTAAILGGSAYWAFYPGGDQAFLACGGGAVGGEIGGPFDLIDAAGRTVTEAKVLEKPALVYFGYTFCPDVCPLDNARNAEAVDILEEKGFDVVPVFISIDPARDTPEVMAEYTANLHPRMIGLTGSDAQVKAASNAFKTYFKKQEGGGEFYLMDHSTFTYLMLPDTGFADFFKREVSADEMAEKVGCFLNAG